MTEAELNLLRTELLNAKSYLEFGSGNSTRMAAALQHLQRITVVESDDRFFQTEVASDPAVRNAWESGRLSYHYINVGETGEWGYPVTGDRIDFWQEYHAEVFRRETDYDLVLVDGRFRIACILQTCLKCPRKTRILVHDFFNRPAYFTVLPFLHWLKQVDTFGLFRIDVKKVKRNRSLLKQYIEIFQYYPEL